MSRTLADLFRTTAMKITLLLLIAIGLSSPAVADDTGNLIQNPGFEEPIPWDSDQPRPKFWLVHAGGPEYVDASAGDAVVGEDTHRGERAVRLTEPRGWNDRWVVANMARLEVSGDETFTLSVWVKVSGFTGREYVRMGIEQFNAEGKLLEENPFQSSGKEYPQAGQWKQLTWTFTTQPDARLIRPLLVLSHGGYEASRATATFDDVSLTRE